MKRALRVREHGECVIGSGRDLEHPELDFLQVIRDRDGKQFFSEHRRGHEWRARFAHYVGAIGMPGGRTLEILPKIADIDDPDETRRHLMRMLAETDQLPALQGDLGYYAASDHIIDAYLRMAADLAWSLMRTGVPRDYRKEDLRSG